MKIVADEWNGTKTSYSGVAGYVERVVYMSGPAYGGALEQVGVTVDTITEMLGRLLEELHDGGALDDEALFRVTGTTGRAQFFDGHEADAP